MISNAFKSAYTNKVSQQNQAIGTATQGVKDLATLGLGLAGFTGALGGGAMAQASQHALAGRVGGIGGNIMLANMQEKILTAQENQQKSIFIEQDTSKIDQAFDKMYNKIEQSNAENKEMQLKVLDTVWNTIERARVKRNTISELEGFYKEGANDND